MSLLVCAIAIPAGVMLQGQPQALADNGTIRLAWVPVNGAERSNSVAQVGPLPPVLYRVDPLACDHTCSAGDTELAICCRGGTNTTAPDAGRRSTATAALQRARFEGALTLRFRHM